jgi:outer membrane receptor protein involved in Fe transport
MKTRQLLLAAATLLGVPLLPAQVPAATAGARPGDDTVTLPEFSVRASPTSEYLAAESITGTRVATKIRDLPFTVNTVTGEFLDDFAAFEFRDQFGYTSSVSVWETLSTGYSLRGFDADVQLRNGFRRIGLIDKVNVERAEIIKGPAASIYGTVLPGGTINVITKKPQDQTGSTASPSAPAATACSAPRPPPPAPPAPATGSSTASTPPPTRATTASPTNTARAARFRRNCSGNPAPAPACTASSNG